MLWRITRRFAGRIFGGTILKILFRLKKNAGKLLEEFIEGILEELPKNLKNYASKRLEEPKKTLDVFSKELLRAFSEKLQESISKQLLEKSHVGALLNF